MKFMHIRIYLFACLFSIISVVEGHAAMPASLEVTHEEKINVNVENGSVAEMLRAMAEKKLFEIKGAVPGDQITLRFSNLSLDEALKKIMRGYNYVLIRQGESGKPLLLLMGKIERSKAPEQTAARGPAQHPQPAIPQAQGGTEARMYVPPSTLPTTGPGTQPTAGALPPPGRAGARGLAVPGTPPGIAGLPPSGTPGAPLEAGAIPGVTPTAPGLPIPGITQPGTATTPPLPIPGGEGQSAGPGMPGGGPVPQPGQATGVAAKDLLTTPTPPSFPSFR
jgi:hypothetical protein